MFNSKSLAQRRAFSKVYKNYVNGQWVASSSTSNIELINPLDNTQVLAHVPKSTEAEFNSIV
jgi:acyl-CoA reductase-like NAD-dependent aldehyde dehydrogenase